MKKFLYLHLICLMTPILYSMDKSLNLEKTATACVDVETVSSAALSKRTYSHLPKELKQIILGYLGEYSYAYGVNINYQQLIKDISPELRRDIEPLQQIRYSPDRRYCIHTCVNNVTGFSYNKKISDFTVTISHTLHNTPVQAQTLKPAVNEDHDELFQITGKIFEPKSVLSVIYCKDLCKSLWYLDTGIYLFDKDRPGITIFRLPYNGMQCLGISADFSKIAVADADTIKIYTLSQDEQANAVAKPVIINQISAFKNYKIIEMIFHNKNILIARLEWENGEGHARIHEGRFIFWRNQSVELESLDT